MNEKWNDKSTEDNEKDIEQGGKVTEQGERLDENMESRMNQKSKQQIICGPSGSGKSLI